MPYKDPHVRAYAQRICRRSIRHPSWRQVAYDCGFVCVNAAEDEWWDTCEIDYNLEFHELFEENKKVNRETPKLQSRILLCRACHQLQGAFFPMNRGNVSRVLEDIDFEMLMLGGIARWKTIYKIV